MLAASIVVAAVGALNRDRNSGWLRFGECASEKESLPSFAPRLRKMGTVPGGFVSGPYRSRMSAVSERRIRAEAELAGAARVGAGSFCAA